MGAEDAFSLGCSEGSRVRVANEQGHLDFEVTLDTGMPAGMVRVDGLPRAEDLGSEVGLNLLTAPAVSDWGEGNVLYSTRVDLQLLPE